MLPIELGDIAGVRTQIELIAVPGPAEQAPTRKQLLDQVDGIVFVVDSQRERIDANIASFEELRQALRGLRSADRRRPARWSSTTSATSPTPTPSRTCTASST